VSAGGANAIDGTSPGLSDRPRSVAGSASREAFRRELRRFRGFSTPYPLTLHFTARNRPSLRHVEPKPTNRPCIEPPPPLAEVVRCLLTTARGGVP
jgi:hypothetical protein